MRVLWLAGLLVLMWQSVVQAQTGSLPAGPGELRDKPVLYEPTNTYYELVLVHSQYPGRYPQGLFHQTAMALAFQRTHKERSGRLAIVDSAELNTWLRDTFKPSNLVWIGLRYWCNYNTLVWVDGEVFKPGSYQNWSSPWNVSGAYKVADPKGNVAQTNECYKKSGAWGVHYWSIGDGFQWNANGQDKHSRMFFVEYPPAPKSADEKAGKSKGEQAGDTSRTGVRNSGETE